MYKTFDRRSPGNHIVYPGVNYKMDVNTQATPGPMSNSLNKTGLKAQKER